MLVPSHPEVLHHDWVPPALVGRSAELEELRAWLGDPVPTHGHPWAAAIRGPTGAGTSVLARLAARRLLEAYRRDRPQATPPLLVSVRVRWCGGTQGVATQLLQRLDEGFRGAGFPVVEIVAGFLRRLAREGRPAVVVLDDAGPDTPDLSPILRGLLHPLRFLPEGVDAAPPVWVLVAGTLDRPGSAAAWARVGFPAAHSVSLPAMSAATLRAVLEDRATRALGRPPPPGWVDGWVERAISKGLGASRGMDLLREALLGRSASRVGSLYAPRGAPSVVTVEPRILRAFAEAEGEDLLALSELRRREAELALAEGARPLPATTLWRRLVHLEAAGLLRRDVRTGGPGGTRSRVELLRPVSDWPVPTAWGRTRPDAVSGGAPARAGPAPAGGSSPRGPSGLGGAGARPTPRAPWS